MTIENRKSGHVRMAPHPARISPMILCERDLRVMARLSERPDGAPLVATADRAGRLVALRRSRIVRAGFAACLASLGALNAATLTDLVEPHRGAAAGLVLVALAAVQALAMLASRPQPASRAISAGRDGRLPARIDEHVPARVAREGRIAGRPYLRVA